MIMPASLAPTLTERSAVPGDALLSHRTNAGVLRERVDLYAARNVFAAAR